MPCALIPVLDLLGGQVVRAVRGDRARYQPIRSVLCEGARPEVVGPALLVAADSDRLYVADLDALTGQAVQLDALAGLLWSLRRDRPTARLWLDAGWPDLVALRDTLARLDAIGPGMAEAIDPVLASEALWPGALGALQDDPLAPRALLSLDRRDGHRLDRAGCWDRPASWPAQLIVMTLERVGADAGPDLATLAEVAARAAPGTRLIGAGGVRDQTDLHAAGAAGASAWLVASALHDGRLGRPRSA
ncbi:HisA/HisF-related TIM barrel protein [Leptothrix discophora]|uniref:HisA/HisF-related TIM barrel protein n=1 Tax=Leptothrix discophora TaxID=89 RepID=A0ABT9G967_LEPDI|nr:HisA/HisF-related TIM barrel protein [Leptothrix discophora]MDP4302748.1 HisA/HisF-related TIM barrel protein [Leptothrix discophora]